MPGFELPSDEVRDHKFLAIVCVLVAMACIAGLLVIVVEGDPMAAWKVGQTSRTGETDRRARK